MHHPEYGYFNTHFLFLVIWLPSLSSGEGINLAYFISKNEIMVLKCEISDSFCCSDINKIEFFKNGKGVCTFKDCRNFFDVPLHREDTRFYRCGCSVGNIRKTHLITTELRETDYGNWSCACSCGDVTCRSNTISILPPDSDEENDQEESGDGSSSLVFNKQRKHSGNERAINLTYFISKNEVMMLKCEIPDDFCCSDINKIEFFKNGDGVCTFKDCLSFFDLPLQREDTRFYRCGCSVNNIRKTHLITTELRDTDYGNWSCACSCGDVTCRSNTISILPPDSHEENDNAPISNKETETENSVGLVVGIVILLTLLIGVSLSIFILVRCYISRRVKTVRENSLTRLLLGRAQDKQCKESSDYAVHMSLVREELEESKTFIPRANRRNQQERKQHIKHATSIVPDDRSSGYYTYCMQESILHIKHRTSTESDVSSSDYYTADCMSTINEDQQEIQSSAQETINGNQEEFIRYKTNSSDKPVWCICFECEEKEQDRERLCCNRVDCITRHQDFETYCFKNIDVTPSNDSEKQREKRTRAYKNYYNWNHGINAAQEGFVILPSCCVGMIRKKFPDPNGEYLGIGKQHFPQQITDNE